MFFYADLDLNEINECYEMVLVAWFTISSTFCIRQCDIFPIVHTVFLSIRKSQIATKDVYISNKWKANEMWQSKSTFTLLLLLFSCHTASL